ncbi:superoxide dismutase family protein [Luteimonas sp. A478]
MRSIHLLFLAPAVLALAACGPSSDPAGEATPPATAPTGLETGMETGVAEPVDTAERMAIAVLSPTESNDTGGQLQFAVVDGNIHVTGEVTGLSAGGEHGFHVHETGDCSAPDATSAGGHFNPEDAEHGRAGQGEHHVGDSDNLMANDEGVAQVDRWLHGATLGDGGAADIVGKGVIVHADADDYVTQPTGGAGDRLACGVIEAQ